jgi:cytochrome P450
MTHRELGLTATTLIVAGSETSEPTTSISTSISTSTSIMQESQAKTKSPNNAASTLISGLVYLLLSNRPVLDKLTSIIRRDFSPTETSSLTKLQQHEYLNAVLKEALRLYPPAPDMLFRTTTNEPATVAGRTVPPHTSVTMNLWAAHHSSENFHRPTEFLPERWMENAPAEFHQDDRAVFHPFSIGPRDCLGKK